MKDIKLAIIFGILFVLLSGLVIYLEWPGAEQVAEPAGEYVSGEAIEEEKAKEVPFSVVFGEHWDESLVDLGCTGVDWWFDDDGELQIEILGCEDTPETQSVEGPGWKPSAAGDSLWRNDPNPIRGAYGVTSEELHRQAIEEILDTMRQQLDALEQDVEALVKMVEAKEE